MRPFIRPANVNLGCYLSGWLFAGQLLHKMLHMVTELLVCGITAQSEHDIHDDLVF